MSNIKPIINETTLPIDDSNGASLQHKTWHESHIILRRLNYVLLSKKRGDDIGLFDNLQDNDMSELDLAIKCEVILHRDFWRSFGYSLLKNAAKAGLSNVVNVLLKHAKDDVEFADKAFKLLFSACLHGHLEVVRVLLEHGVDMHKFSYYNGSFITCLNIASKTGNLALVRLLLDFGADPNLVRLECGYPPLMGAIMYGWVDVVRLLLDHGADINWTKTPNGWRSAICCACAYNHIDIAELLLLDYGADVNARNNVGDTPLMIVLSNRPDSKDLLQLLLEHGADPSIANKGKTALDYVAEGSEIAHMLINLQLEPVLK